MRMAQSARRRFEAEVPAAETDGRDAVAGPAEGALRDLSVRWCHGCFGMQSRRPRNLSQRSLLLWGHGSRRARLLQRKDREPARQLPVPEVPAQLRILDSVDAAHEEGPAAGRRRRGRPRQVRQAARLPAPSRRPRELQDLRTQVRDPVAAFAGVRRSARRAARRRGPRAGDRGGLGEPDAPVEAKPAIPARFTRKSTGWK